LLLQQFQSAKRKTHAHGLPIPYLGRSVHPARLLSKQFRRDYYLDPSQYPEPWGPPLPTTGGRLHFVVDAKDSNSAFQLPYTVSFAGFTFVLDENINTTSVTNGDVDWMQLFVTGEEAKAVLSFHTTSDTFLQKSFPTSLSVLDANKKTVVDGMTTKLSVPSASNNALSVTYVASMANYTTVVIHIHNYGSSTAQVNSLKLNAVPLSSVSLPFTVPANGGHVTLTTRALNFREGSVWTVELNTSSSILGNGGRFGKETFFVQGWQKSGAMACEGPSGSDPTGYNFVRNEIGMNAFYGSGKCDAALSSITSAAMANGYFILAEGESSSRKYSPSVFPALMAIEIGDEVDGDATQTALHNQRAIAAQLNNPGIMVFQGAKTNHIIGRFAGISDIQGLDFYIAGCAPHITPALTPMALQGSRDYIRNMRNNHMPLQTWGYSQFVAKDWSTIPNGNEVIVQLASTALAGVKSVMLFQPDEAQMGNNEVAIASGFIASMKAIGELIRTGDAEGAILTTSDGTAKTSMTEVIQAPNNTYVFVVVNTNGNGYNDLLCSIGLSNHWSFQSYTLSWVQAEIQPSPTTSTGTLTHLTLREVVKGQQVDPVNGVTGSFSGTTLRLSNIELGTQDDIARIFVAFLS